MAHSRKISRQAISRWENALSYPDIVQLPNIAAYFETTVDDLLGVKKTVKRQKMLYFQFRWQESADIINRYLEEFDAHGTDHISVDLNEE